MTEPGELKIHADPEDLPQAEIIGRAELSDGRSCLVLRANIEGQVRNIVLMLDALEGRELSGPAVATELRAIRDAVDNATGRLARPIADLSRTTDNLSKSTAELADVLARQRDL
ncbi:MAG: hypothetical protein OYH76_17505 [Defluviicoccus sp.]|nr:hypothetical protein [Defluviicoccus sp.]MDE0277694.1 hypothetical protein [Defluviicoccus sp.]